MNAQEEVRRMEERLENLLRQYDESAVDISKEIMSEIKGRSKNYREVSNYLNRLKASALWNNGSRYDFLFSLIQDALEKEKNDLPIANRP